MDRVRYKGAWAHRVRVEAGCGLRGHHWDGAAVRVLRYPWVDAGPGLADRGLLHDGVLREGAGGDAERDRLDHPRVPGGAVCVHQRAPEGGGHRRIVGGHAGSSGEVP